MLVWDGKCETTLNHGMLGWNLANEVEFGLLVDEFQGFGLVMMDMSIFKMINLEKKIADRFGILGRVVGWD